jgi:hypothetical protein
MASIYMIAEEYTEDDIYNMDEIGLIQPGIKKDIGHITAVLNMNASGTGRLPI